MPKDGENNKNDKRVSGVIMIRDRVLIAKERIGTVDFKAGENQHKK
jgi:hypothetical protein